MNLRIEHPRKTWHREKYVVPSLKEANDLGWEKLMCISNMTEREELVVRTGLFDLRITVSVLLRLKYVK